MIRKAKEITVTVQVSRDLVDTAFGILSTALSQFQYKYARIEIKTPEIKIEEKGV